MRIVSHQRDGQWRGGIEVAGRVVDLADAMTSAGLAPSAEKAPTTVREFLEATDTAGRAALDDHLDDACAELFERAPALEGLRLGPPVPDPEKVICLGLNYRDHAEEVGAPLPEVPMFFAKFASSLAGPYDDIVPPRDTHAVDYEAEMAVVIGRAGRYIAEDDALEHIAGVMAFNDVSARDLQLANQLWTGGKAVDTFAPCGPALVTLDEFDDVQSLRVGARVNGRTLQDGTTASMAFSAARIVAFLSRVMTLKPGDVIATGTPAGVGQSQRPPIFLRDGDVVEVVLDGVGTLRNRVVAAQ